MSALTCQVSELQAEIEDAKASLETSLVAAADLQERRRALKEELAAAASHTAELEAELAAACAELSESKRRAASASSERDSLAVQLTQANNVVGDLHREVLLLTKTVRRLEAHQFQHDSAAGSDISFTSSLGEDPMGLRLDPEDLNSPVSLAATGASGLTPSSGKARSRARPRPTGASPSLAPASSSDLSSHPVGSLTRSEDLLSRQDSGAASSSSSQATALVTPALDAAEGAAATPTYSEMTRSALRFSSDLLSRIHDVRDQVRSLKTSVQETGSRQKALRRHKSNSPAAGVDAEARRQRLARTSMPAALESPVRQPAAAVEKPRGSSFFGLFGGRSKAEAPVEQTPPPSKRVEDRSPGQRIEAAFDKMWGGMGDDSPLDVRAAFKTGMTPE